MRKDWEGEMFVDARLVAGLQLAAPAVLRLEPDDLLSSSPIST